MATGSKSEVIRTWGPGESYPAVERSMLREPIHRGPRRRRLRHINASTVACAFLASTFQTSMAQGCISLKGSTECPSFNASSISTDAANIGLYPFLAGVSGIGSFDSGLRTYIENGYAQVKYAFLHQYPRTDCTNIVLDISSYWAALNLNLTTQQTSMQDTRPHSSATRSCRVR